MGIDIYLQWPDMTEEERKPQFTGFDTRAGHVGYLREAYHGKYYGTKALVPEAFEAPTGEAVIPAGTMRGRLGAVAEVVAARCRITYGTNDPEFIRRTFKAYGDFVDLAEQMEAIKGVPCTVFASY